MKLSKLAISVSFALLIIIYVSHSLVDNIKNTPYRVLIATIPQSFSPRTNVVNYYHSLSIQLYFPMFDLNQNGELESNFFDLSQTKSLDKGMTRFRFCLKENLKYSDGSAISIEDVHSSLLAVHKNQVFLPHIKTVNLDRDNCLIVSLSRKSIDYFYQLNTPNTTVIKRDYESSRPGFPPGMGNYFVSDHTHETLVLKANKEFNDGDLQEIHIIALDKNKKELNRGIDDWNLVSSIVSIPSKISDMSNKIVRPGLKTLFFLVMLKNKKVREEFITCFPLEKFKKVDVLNETIDTPGILPVGMSGFKTSFRRVFPKSDKCKGKKEKSIPFYNVYGRIKDQIDQAISQANNDLPVKLVYKEADHAEIQRVLFTHDSEHVVLLANSAINAAPSSYFEGFHGETRVIPQSIPFLKDTLVAAYSSETESDRAELFEKAHLKVIESGFVIPIGQCKHTLMYPKWIYGINFVNQYQVFPDFSKFKVSILRRIIAELRHELQF